PLDRLDFTGVVNDGYATRVRGYIAAQVTGAYRFWISGDDTAWLRPSDDDSPSLTKLIARVPGPVDYREFDRYPSQASAYVHLTAGQRYYFEILHHEVYGAEHFSVAWEVPGNRRAIVSGAFLEPWMGDARDADDDGLPDDWAAAARLGAPEDGGSAAYADPDGDHLNNLEEFRLGSDPQVADATGRPGLLTREI